MKFGVILKEPAHTVSNKMDGQEQKRWADKTLMVTKQKKLENNVIQSVYQMTQEAVFA